MKTTLKQMRNRVMGQYVKGLRENRNLTQRALAGKLGLPYYTFISQVEAGVTSVPPDKIADWAEALGVSVEDMKTIFHMLTTTRAHEHTLQTN